MSMNRRPHFKLPGQDEDGRVKCPHCGCEDLRGEVTHVYEGEEGCVIKERRVRCRHCGRPLQTVEILKKDFDALRRKASEDAD